MKEKWLKCKIQRGMFPDEYAIGTQTATAQHFSAFVSGDLLKFDAPKNGKWKEIDGFMKVNEIEEEEDNSLIYLPEDPLSPTVGREIYVKSSQLRL